jgi:beta-aspartyl-peptidase (threonine type)
LAVDDHPIPSQKGSSQLQRRQHLPCYGHSRWTTHHSKEFLFPVFIIMSSNALAVLGLQRYRIAIHGGAGVIERGSLSPEQEEQIRGDLEKALMAGLEVLKDLDVKCSCKSELRMEQDAQCVCSPAINAVEAAVIALEESEWFNAGKGAVFTFKGDHEMDASIMEGVKRRAGAVAGIRTCRNPIRGARLVMESTQHCFLAGSEADHFLAHSGLEVVPNTWFDTDRRREQLNQALTGNPIIVKASQAGNNAAVLEKKFGTVGAVAVDTYGNVAAATSTGGMTNKRYGRVGDSPVIGAGTWADNRFCAVSATGHGEFFIRNAVAHDIASRVRYLGESVKEACEHVIKRGDLASDGGEGGVVAIDPKTRQAVLCFNTPGMYRAWLDDEGIIRTAIYSDDE